MGIGVGTAALIAAGVGTATAVGTSVYQSKQADKAKRDAEQQRKKAEDQRKKEIENQAILADKEKQSEMTKASMEAERLMKSSGGGSVFGGSSGGGQMY